MKDFPIIKTPRLHLKRLSASDIPTIVSYAGHKAISDNTLSFPHPYFEEHAIGWMNMQQQGFKEKSAYIFGIYLTAGGFIGGMGLHLVKEHNRAELGYWIGVPHWNKGYASEAGKAVLAYGFNELQLNKIYATHYLDNPASEKVLQKIGMTREAELKQHYLKGDEYRDVRQYCMFKGEVRTV